MFSKIFKNNPIFKIHLLKKEIFKNIFLNISQKFFFLSFLKKIFFLNFSLKHIFNFLFIIFSFLNFSSAENGKEFTSKVGGEITKFGNNIVSTLTLSFMIVAFCVFAFGIGKFIYARYYSNNSKETFKDLKAGQDFMLWGVIALFILLSIWGIIKILQGFVGIDSSNNKSIKPIRFSSSISKKTNKKPASTDNKLLVPDTKLNIKPNPDFKPDDQPNDNKKNESKTIFSKSGQKFHNGEENLFIKYDKQKVGEFAPIKKGIKILNSKNTNLKEDLETILSKYPDASGIIPGALTDINFVSQGINVSNGEIFGDDVFHKYGIIYTEKGKINFTHSTYFNNDKNNFKQNLLKKVINEEENLLFLPSVYRNGNSLTSDKNIQHCLIRMESGNDVKIGVVIFDEEIDYNKAIEILTGLNNNNDNDKIKLTHIYYLDAGAWSENVRKIDGNFIKKGTRNKDKVTNYIIFE